jgi:murein DD-endopeptidase MepM/ murein hydrolase activator NlpD
MVKAPVRSNPKDRLLQLLDDPEVQAQLRDILREEGRGVSSPNGSTSSDSSPSSSAEAAQVMKMMLEMLRQQNKAIAQQTRTFAQVGRTVNAIQGTAQASRQWGNVTRDAQDVGRMILLGGAGIAIVLFTFVLTMISLKNALVQTLGMSKGNDPAATLYTSVGEIPPILEGGTVLGIPVTSGLGMRQHPITKRERMHEGVDLGTDSGTPVFAPVNAQVECRKQDGGYGYYAQYPLNERQTVILGHLLSCISGSMNAGEIIGYTGNSGDSTAPHLHLQVNEGDTPVVPSIALAVSTLKAAPLEPLNTMVAAIYPAIVGQESGGDHTASNTASGKEAIGKTQVMEYNVTPWSQQALGKEIGISEFRNSPDLQQQISLYELYQVSAEQMATSSMNTELAMWRVAAVWYSGNPNRERDYSPIPNQPNSPSVGGYVDSVLDRVKNAPSTKR